MNRRPDDIETRLRQLPSPEPADGLKHRVLAAATLAPAATWRDRAWYSTGWRLAAAGLLLTLLAADRWVVPPRSAGSPGIDAATAAELQALEAVGSELGVPADTMRRLGGRGGIAPQSARMSIDEALSALPPPR